MPAEVEFDVGLSSPALHQRNDARSHDNKNDDNGKRFKVPFAHSMADLHQASEAMITLRERGPYATNRIGMLRASSLKALANQWSVNLDQRAGGLSRP
jgi:hypothetical protein